MRTLVEIEDDAIKALDRIAQAEKLSRSALIRKAVASLLEKHEFSQRQDAFGLWATAGEARDGVEYQRSLREEW